MVRGNHLKPENFAKWIRKANKQILSGIYF